MGRIHRDLTAFLLLTAHHRRRCAGGGRHAQQIFGATGNACVRCLASYGNGGDHHPTSRRCRAGWWLLIPIGRLAGLSAVVTLLLIQGGDGPCAGHAHRRAALPGSSVSSGTSRSASYRRRQAFWVASDPHLVAYLVGVPSTTWPSSGCCFRHFPKHTRAVLKPTTAW